MTTTPTTRTPACPPDSLASSDAVLTVENLRVRFDTEEGQLYAADGVSFSVPRGKMLALVGESGCGKSTTAYSILRLIQKPGSIVGGSIRFFPRDGYPVDLAALRDKDPVLYRIRGGAISMIFQEPMAALSPVHTIGNQLCEAVRLHQHVSRSQARERAIAMLGHVGIPGPAARLSQYPFELSGGMCQRVVIAMAMIGNPQLLIADEPTTALDVTIQAQVMGLIKRLQGEMGTSTLLITHNLGVVAQIADEVAVMYLGRVVERGPVRQVLKHPAHPYTMGLLASLPGLARSKAKLPAIAGAVPSLAQRLSGCPFHPRCPYAQPGRCDIGTPPIMQHMTGDQYVACLRANEIQPEKVPP